MSSRFGFPETYFGFLICKSIFEIFRQAKNRSSVWMSGFTFSIIILREVRS